MASKAYENQKRTLNYSKKRVDKAGRDIRHHCEGEARKESIEIIQNFREVHLYPLMLIKNHLSKAAKKVSKKCIVARRLKRLPTIINKLERPTLDGKESNALKLTRMQDIGGCRAIVPNLEHLNKLHEVLSSSSCVHKIVKTDNYLTPKNSGYGGIHLIYSCFQGSNEDNDWKKTKIEVQLRTELQHAWATSLEIIDTLEGIELKTSMEGQEEWRRFFMISGQLVAHKEKACALEKKEVSDLVTELVTLEQKLEVRKKIFQYKLAIDITTGTPEAQRSLKTHQGMFLVILKNGDVKRKDGKIALKVTLTTFPQKQTEDALKELAMSEDDEEVMIAVLVAASDVRNLKKAYPNYFGSTGQFTKFLTSLISPKPDSTQTKTGKNKITRKNKGNP